MNILDANGAAYFNAIPVASDFVGRWFKTSGDAVCLTLSAELALAGGGNVSGELLADFTSDPTETAAIVPMSMPDGCLHTSFGTITLAAQKIVLANALTASVLGVTLAFPIAGSMRFRWHPTSIGSLVSTPNTLKMFVQVGLEG